MRLDEQQYRYSFALLARRRVLAGADSFPVVGQSRTSGLFIP